MNSWAPTAFAAATTSSGLASGRPKAMFSRTVPAKRKPSCGTIPSWRRSDSCVTSRRSIPSTVTRPDVERDPVEHLGAAAVGEADVVEAHVAGDARQLARTGPVLHLDLLLEQ